MGFREDPQGGQLNTMLDAMEVPSHSRQLLLQLNSQRTKGFLCDVIIVVQNALFRAHKNILAASSVYLKSLVVHDNLINLDHEMVSPSIFRIILDFIYTGRLGDGEPTSEQLFGAVLAAASYLQIADLVSLCKKKLKRNGKYCHGNQLHQHGLCPPERHCSPLCGLDLSKKSPSRPSNQLHSDGPETRDPPIPGRTDSPIISASVLTNSNSYKDQNHGYPKRANTPPVPHPEPFRNSISNSHLRNESRDMMFDWMKPEPIGNYVDESDREKDLDREEKGESSPLSQQPRYPSIESNEPDDDKSTSEETGSSGDPSPSSNLERYHCNHLYDPESYGDNLYVCIPCGKGFPSSEQLNAHVEAHNEDELYHKDIMEPPVPFLEKTSQSLGDIIRPYRCSSCEKSYKDPATLRQHEKTHWLTRPYPCSICGKKFTQRGTMTRHMRSHLGLKPFACDACGMRFTRQYRLTEHMRIHSGEKPYECQVCGGKFAQQRNLISHMKMHTTGPDGKPKLDFPDSVYAMAKFTADHLGLKQEKAAEILSQTSHFLNDPKTIESLYPLAKFTAEQFGLTQEKAAEVLTQSQLLGTDRIIERFSSP
ncbi:unnamed protein product [Ranitomeya imitator]|uniref:Hypermethylated in cancer 1 n=1 Tax=Ranitomeya imitator TaxID=111125 RepID=A0ABN9MDT2_9NEOB|nr:unnamed protein product [Ranitomeya imitator]